MNNSGAIRHRRVPRDLKIIYCILGLYCLFNITSFLLVFSGALKSTTELFSNSIWALPEAPVWKNFADAWKIGKIGRYTANSVYVTGVSVILTVILASMAAYVLGRIRFRFKSVVMTVFMIGMMLPPFVIAIPLFNLLEQFGLTNSLNGLILVYVTKQLPFSIFVLTSFYKGIPFDMEEAAVIDGANPVRTFAQIIMPLTGPAMTAVTINNILNIWNEFLYALIFLTKKKLYTLPVGLFYLSQAAEYSSAWPVLFAGMITSVVPVLIIFAVFQKQFAEGISQGAIKG